jgi:hypothetical protein
MRMPRLTSPLPGVASPGELLDRARGRVVTVSAELGVRVLEPIER